MRHLLFILISATCLACPGAQPGPIDPVDSGVVAQDAGSPVDAGLSDLGAPLSDDAGQAAVDSGAPALDAGAACDGPNPQGCQNDDECSGEQVCDQSACAASSCSCQDGQWLCTEDCGGGLCVELENNACEGNNPVGCLDDADCGAGFVCDPSVCAPSSCFCGPGDVWACTRDCRGGRCTADDSLSCGDLPAPSGCSQYGCPQEQTCVREEGECLPSSCHCGENQVWVCTRDCAGGGQCMP